MLKKRNIIILVLAIAIAVPFLTIDSGAKAQSVGILDPAQPILRNATYSNSQLQAVDEAGIRLSDGQIGVVRTNSVGTVIVNRLANAGEQEIYNAFVASETIGTSIDNLTGQQEGQNWKPWIDSRTVELQSCESDMQTGQASQFNSLGNNAQNITIERMQECIELNAKINRITINRLYDLLISEGIIDPS